MCLAVIEGIGQLVGRLVFLFGRMAFRVFPQFVSLSEFGIDGV